MTALFQSLHPYLLWRDTLFLGTGFKGFPGTKKKPSSHTSLKSHLDQHQLLMMPDIGRRGLRRKAAIAGED
jgi:hypothetical protein